MQVKLKICSGCNQPKPIWKREGKDLYCQFCWSKIKPQTPLKQSALPKSSRPIPKQSDRRKKLDAAYSVLRKQYLLDHPNCEIAVAGICKGKSSQIHHSFDAGDREKYMNDTSTWFATDFACHEYVHNNTVWAKEQGFLK